MKKIIKEYGVLILIILLASILRLWHLDSVPVSLFGDEADVGYQAYSLAQTGKDYMGNLLPSQVESLADKKPALYSYTLIPFVAVFGISPIGVRLPAALFGILNVLLIYLIAQSFFKNKAISLLSALLLAISPWHIQYSRFGFEGTEMLSFYLGGLYCFFKGINNYRWLVLSSALFGLTLWTYHSAKIFLPLTIIILIIIWRKELINIPKKYLLISALTLIIVSAPIGWDILFGGGTERFGSTSVLNDKTIIGEIGSKRLQDQKRSQKTSPSIPDRFFHNQTFSFADKLIRNYFQVYSFEFLFIKGDPNLRHSLPDFGEFYKIEALFLIAGIIFLFIKNTDKKIKALIVLWLLFAPIPAIITSDGGTHASRLLFMLPPLILLIACGVYYLWEIIPLKFRKYYIFITTIAFVLSLAFYQHNYWNHYPWDSEKWWQAGYEDTIKSALDLSNQYDKIIISNADEPSLISFLSFSKFPPADFQKNDPFEKELIPGFGEMGKLNKYYFPEQGKEIGLYELGKVLPRDVLYIATQKEIVQNLQSEPERIPSDIRLVKIITYPSGKPAFYFFDKGSK